MKREASENYIRIDSYEDATNVEIHLPKIKPGQLIFLIGSLDRARDELFGHLSEEGKALCGVQNCLDSLTN